MVERQLPKNDVWFLGSCRAGTRERILAAVSADQTSLLARYHTAAARVRATTMMQSLRPRKCGRLEHGFLRVRCESFHAEHLVAFICKRRGFCPSCGAMRIIACIEDPVVIEKILAHLDAKAAATQTARPPPCRALPPGPLG